MVDSLSVGDKPPARVGPYEGVDGRVEGVEGAHTGQVLISMDHSTLCRVQLNLKEGYSGSEKKTSRKICLFYSVSNNFSL